MPETSPELRKARARIAAAEGELSRVFSAWKPNLSVSGQVAYNTQLIELDFGGILGGIVTAVGGDPSTLDLPPATVIQPHWTVAGVATLRQLLFDPSAWFGPGIARASVDAQRAGADAATDELLFAAAQLYAGLQAVDALEGAAERAVRVADARIEQAEVRVESGLATPLDAIRARTRKTEANSELARIVAQRRALQADLQTILGTDHPVRVVSAPLPEDLGEPGSGVGDRRDVIAQEAAVEAAEKNAGRTKWLWLPSLFFEAQGTATNVAGFGGNHYFGVASIGLSLPLYDGGLRYAERDVAEANLAQAQASLDATRSRGLALMEKARAQLDEARARAELAEAQLDLAERAVAQVEDLRNNGLATSLDLDDADLRRFGADRQLADRRLDVALSRLRLHYAQGGRLK
ncbi:MAG: TolC family protein [Deltaproteobacteria bacterium]